MNTLNNYLEILNEDLKSLEAIFIQKPLDLYQQIKEIVLNGKVNNYLKSEQIENVFLFKNEIRLLNTVFLKIEENSDEKLYKELPIFKILVNISYFDDTDYNKGGTVNFIKIYLHETINEEIANMPLIEFVNKIKDKLIRKQIEYIDKHIVELLEEVDDLNSKKINLENLLIKK